ncbi:MAG: HlyC/CorC family transporter [Chlamydiia bacterium]|nr:HlyC/CorC family transporter [Chlamydiia bacterium]
MNSEALLWLTLNIVSIVVLSFYSTIEMAVISFSKVRLQYYVSQGNAKAEKLAWLLGNSSRLFGTTLIGVNVAMMFGSEFAREFHESIGINPDFAPLSQVLIVVIFGELAPIFAARRYPENFSMLGANLLYYSAILMKPLLLIISGVTHLVHFFLGGKTEEFNLYFNQEEIKKVLEEHAEDQPASGSTEELNLIVSNIFELREKRADLIMEPIRNVVKLPSNASVRKLRQVMLGTKQPCVLVFHKDPRNIVGVAFARDYLREGDNKRIADFARDPWFIPEDMAAVQVLHQFRQNNEPVAIVVNTQGKPIGALTLQDVLDEIFGDAGGVQIGQRQRGKQMIERTFPGSMKIEEFNSLFGAALPFEEPHETLAHLLAREIGHQPEPGESISLPPYEIQVKEATLLDVTSVTVKSVLD